MGREQSHEIPQRKIPSSACGEQLPQAPVYIRADQLCKEEPGHQVDREPASMPL